MVARAAQSPSDADEPMWTMEVLKVQPGMFGATLGYLITLIGQMELPVSPLALRSIRLSPLLRCCYPASRVLYLEAP
jgi:hypothetical protein